MTTSTGLIVYFVEIEANSPRYAIQLNLYAIPTSSQATTLGYSLASGASWSLPATATTPTLTFNSAFGLLIGQYAGTYPTTAQTTNQQFVSTITPIISPVNSYVFTISLIKNNYSNPNSIICTVPLNASLGELVTYTPANLVWHEINQSDYSNFSIQVYDQNLNILNLNDNEFTIHLGFLSSNENVPSKK